MQELVEKYIPLANKLAYQKKRSFPRVDIDELKSAAYFGLVQAASRFNSDRGVMFSTFAYPRILGAILDYLRELGFFKKSKTQNIEFFEDQLVEKGSDLDEIFEAISQDFDDQSKMIMRLYFLDDYSMKEVGDKFHVSESRISQLIKNCKEKICNKWCECDLVAA